MSQLILYLIPSDTPHTFVYYMYLGLRPPHLSRKKNETYLINLPDLIQKIKIKEKENSLDINYRTLIAYLPMTTNTYECAMCHETFIKTWTDEEAIEEMKELFGNVPESERSMICEDCFNKLKGAI